MLLLISGSREGFTYEEFVEEIDNLISYEGTTPEVLVVGDAKGIDAYARKWASTVGCKLYVFEADWDRLGKKAGCVRNSEMVHFVEGLAVRRSRRGLSGQVRVLALRYDHSRGTTDLIKTARAHKMVVKIVDKSSFNME